MVSVTVSAGHFPARRRLDAGRERALVDAVPVDADLLDRLAVEERVRLLAAEVALVDLVADRRRAEGVEERPGARSRVEVGLVGGDAARRGDEHDVADRDQAVLVVVVVGDVGGEADALRHQLDLDRARVADVVQAEALLAGGRAEAHVGRRGCGGRRRRRLGAGAGRGRDDRRGARRARGRAGENQRARRRRIALPCGSAPWRRRIAARARTGRSGRGADRPRRAGRSIRRRRCRARAATRSRALPPSSPRRGRVRRGSSPRRIGERGPHLDRERLGGHGAGSAKAVTTTSPTAGASARIIAPTSLSPASANTSGGGAAGAVRPSQAASARAPAGLCAASSSARRPSREHDAIEPARPVRAGEAGLDGAAIDVDAGVVERLEQRHRDERVGDLVLAGEGEPHRAVGPCRRVAA